MAATRAELTASMEDYLEAIHVLSQQKRVVRIKDIAKRMGVKMPSVTGALKVLSERGLVHHERYEDVELTPEGQQIGERICQRHEQLRDFLIDVLAVPPAVAEDEACKLEHAVAPHTLERLVKFAEFVRTCARGQPDFLRHFQHYLEHGEHPDECGQRRSADADHTAESGREPKSGTLNDLRPGDKAKVVRVAGRGPIHRRLMDMGLVAGEEIEVERVAPLGDPVEIKLKQYHLSLRRAEAERIHVQQ